MSFKTTHAPNQVLGCLQRMQPDSPEIAPSIG